MDVNSTRRLLMAVAVCVTGVAPGVAAQTPSGTPRYMGPEQLAALVQKDTNYWGKLIKARNIRAD